MYKMSASRACCLLLVVTTLCAHARANCDHPTEEDMGYGYLKFREGSLAIITCSDGAERLLVCQNGHWRLGMASEGPCPRPTCRKPPEPPHLMDTEVTGHYEGDNITYFCKNGLLGEPLSLTCQRKKKRNNKGFRYKWKNTASNRRLANTNCSLPPGRCLMEDAPYRFVEPDDEGESFGYPVYDSGDLVLLACETGYHIDNEMVVCNADGTWDVQPLPTCHPLVCTLTEIDHFVGSSLNASYGETVRLACEDNYMLVPQNEYLSCTDEDMILYSGWDKPIPNCQAIKCPDIQLIENGDLVRHGRGYVGDSVVASCYSGFTLRGPLRRYCTKAGSWSGTNQICDDGESTCGNPGIPVGGEKVGSSYNAGDVVRFSCKRYFTMFGDPVRTCLPQGIWTGREVRCIGPFEYNTEMEARTKLVAAINTLSLETIDSKLEVERINKLKGKEVNLGGQDMSAVNDAQRSDLGQLVNKGGLDVYFMLDTSGSISDKDRNKSLAIVRGLIPQLGISDDRMGTRIGLVAFNNEVWMATPVSEGTSIRSINEALDYIESNAKSQGGTAHRKAIDKISTLISTARSQKETIAIIIITDGNQNEGGKPGPAMEALIKHYRYDFKVYCLGVGNVNMETLKSLATRDEYIIRVRNWENYNVISQLLSNNTDCSRCGVAGTMKAFVDNPENTFAEKDIWRWMGALYLYDFENTKPTEDQFKDPHNNFHCGVSLLSLGQDIQQSDWVLTAAHCVKDYRHGQLLVKFGSLHINKTLEDNPLIVRVKRIFVHSDYDDDTELNDIALLQLITAIPFNVDIRPVCLPSDNSQDLYKEGKPAVVTGWGFWNETMVDNKIHNYNLKNLIVNIQDSQTCRESTQNLKATFSEGKNFCAGGVKTKHGDILDSCKKDSGGPLMVSESDDDGFTTWTQIGIVSFGDGCGEKGGVYTNVTTYMSWIEETIANA